MYNLTYFVHIRLSQSDGSLEELEMIGRCFRIPPVLVTKFQENQIIALMNACRWKCSKSHVSLLYGLSLRFYPCIYFLACLCSPPIVFAVHRHYFFTGSILMPNRIKRVWKTLFSQS